jgi:hypothetical protein
VPDPPVGVAATVKGLGQRAMGLAALARRRRLVDGRPDQRVAEVERCGPGPDPDQPGLLGRVEGASTHAEERRRRGHGRLTAGVLGRGDQQQGLRVAREAVHPLQERPLQLVGQRQLERQRLGPRQLRRRQGRRQLDQGQRVAAGLGGQPLAHTRVHRRRRPRRQQRRHGLLVQAPDLQLGQPGGVEPARVTAAGGEQHRHPFSLQPPGDEHQGVGRRLVEPVRVVDHTQHGPPLGHLGEQAEDGHRGQEPVVVAATLQAERGPKGRGLGPGQAPDLTEDRPQQLVQAGEGQLGLGLDAARLQDLHVGSMLDGILEQRRLPRTSLPAQDEDAAPETPGGVQERRQRRALGVPAVQHHHPADSLAPGRRTGRSRESASDPCYEDQRSRWSVMCGAPAGIEPGTPSSPFVLPCTCNKAPAGQGTVSVRG